MGCFMSACSQVGRENADVWNVLELEVVRQMGEKERGNEGAGCADMKPGLGPGVQGGKGGSLSER